MIDKSKLNFYKCQHYADGVPFRGIYVIIHRELGITKIGSMNRQLYWRVKELQRRHFCTMAGFSGNKEAKKAGFGEAQAIDLFEIASPLDLVEIEKAVHAQLKNAGHEVVISEKASNNNNSDSSEFYRFNCDTVKVMIMGELVELRVR